MVWAGVGFCTSAASLVLSQDARCAPRERRAAGRVASADGEGRIKSVLCIIQEMWVSMWMYGRAWIRLVRFWREGGGLGCCGCVASGVYNQRCRPCRNLGLDVSARVAGNGLVVYGCRTTGDHNNNLGANRRGRAMRVWVCVCVSKSERGKSEEGRGQVPASRAEMSRSVRALARVLGAAR